MDATAIGILLLARLGSSRLPGKVLFNVAGKTLLEHVILRLGNVRRPARLIVATTTAPADDAVAMVAAAAGCEVFRGQTDNVLARCLGACRAFGIATAVRLGADEPFVDWEIIDQLLDVFEEAKARGEPLDYAANTLERTYPDGLDIDVMPASAFARIIEAIADLPPHERAVHESNVISYIHQRQESFRIHSMTGRADYSHLRWTIDTPADYALVREVYDALYPDNPRFLTKDVLALIERRPELARLNAGVVPVTGYWTASEQEKLQRIVARNQDHAGAEAREDPSA